jgi:hypothetical protein
LPPQNGGVLSWKSLSNSTKPRTTLSTFRLWKNLSSLFTKAIQLQSLRPFPHLWTRLRWSTQSPATTTPTNEWLVSLLKLRTWWFTTASTISSTSARLDLAKRSTLKWEVALSQGGKLLP